ncbi:hypothetical protein U0070_021753 [Myodes glareolus]|uniref:Immunoglobulin-like beta-sandwich domain-containing protein n=1 Tax=Myodes glareolus TaxID=447135 RepID=A0AAW0H6L2_MYOGA
MYQGVSFRHLLLVLQLAQLPAILQGKTVVVGREGDTADLPCKSSQEKSMFFIWKLSDQTRILGNQNNFVTRGSKAGRKGDTFQEKGTTYCEQLNLEW